MAKASPIQGNFTGGEVSPLLYGRVDSDRYKVSLATCLNFIPTLQGALTRTPGTVFVEETKDSSKVSRLVPFEFSTTQAYMLEFGDTYIRFYMNDGQIVFMAAPYEVVTPYLEADLYQLKFTQSADVLYIVHPNYPPAALTRTGHTAWTLTPLTFSDGPYLPVNSVAATAMSCSAHSGSVTVTATSITGINGGVGFLLTDVGRLLRMFDGTSWSQLVITAFTSTTVVTATVLVTNAPTTNVTAWRLGLYSKTTGYPGAITFHEDRLVLGGCPAAPQRLDGSNTSDYLNFSPTSILGAVADNNAYNFTLNANDVNVIRWHASDEKGLLAGTVGGEWVLRPAVTSGAMSPTNVSAKQVTQYGSANIQPAQVGKATLFIQRSSRKARELQYWYNVDGFLAPDLTVLAEHIAQTGLTQVCFQKEPQSIIWCVRSDGTLAALTYERELDAVKAAWSRHVVGGASDAAGTQARVESVACIPSVDGSHDELWLIVQRYINGSIKRYVEYMTKIFDATTLQQDSFFVSAGLTFDNPIPLTSVTLASPPVVTSAAHGLTTGDKVRIDAALGLLDSDKNSVVNSQVFQVGTTTTNTFQLKDASGNTISFVGLTPYISAGQIRKLVSHLSGLDHLDGESVQVLADGAVQPNQTVASGAITLAQPGAVVTVGLGYNSDIQMLRLEAGATDGTSFGKTRRTNRFGVLLERSLGLKFGTSFDQLDTITFRTSSDPMSRAPALFSGIVSETLDADYDFENQLCFRQDQPLPSTILAIMPQLVTQDRG